ncbi:MAG: hypothetical protein KF905_13735 [Flavobacteriales bacterium]|nr:hypothetical protein [Flavobacteriales bacterium]
MEQLVHLLDAQQNAPPLPPPPKLSTANRRFLGLLCHPDEYTYQQVAALMNVKLSTVHTFRSRLFVRFGVKSKLGLVQLGKSWGLG